MATSTADTPTTDAPSDARPTSRTFADDDLLALDALAVLDAPFAAETAELLAQLDAMDAATDTLVSRYDAVDWGTTGTGVVGFTQLLTVGGLTGRFHCIVTIVGKHVGERWIEARWHVSLLETDLPEGFGQT